MNACWCITVVVKIWKQPVNVFGEQIGNLWQLFTKNIVHQLEAIDIVCTCGTSSSVQSLSHVQLFVTP